MVMPNISGYRNCWWLSSPEIGPGTHRSTGAQGNDVREALGTPTSLPAYGVMPDDKTVDNRKERGAAIVGESPFLTFTNVRVFESVVRHESFSRAAEELRVSQPYISAQIAGLETKLGIELFRRVGRRAYVTEAGRMLRTHAVRILNELADAERALVEVRGVVAGPLSMAATSTPASYLIPRCLEKFLAEHPNVSVSLKIYGSPDVELAVIEGRSDLGVMVSQPVSAGFIVDDLGTDQLVVVVGCKHPFAGKAEISVDELVEQTFISREPTSGTRRFVEARLREIGRTLHYGPELNSNEAIKALVASNIGISILSEHAVRPELQIGRLVAVRIHGLTLVRSLSLISCAESKLSPAARAMRAVFIAETTAGPNAI
jgi:LysR family transcriptional regulator, low CO2-responsive transcriptional regulator